MALLLLALILYIFALPLLIAIAVVKYFLSLFGSDLHKSQEPTNIRHF